MVSAQDFDTFTQEVDVRSTVPISLNINLTQIVSTLQVAVLESSDKRPPRVTRESDTIRV